MIALYEEKKSLDETVNVAVENEEGEGTADFFVKQNFVQTT